MTAVEIVQTGLALAGVAGIGGIWFRLGALTQGHEGLRHRIEILENHVFKRS